MATRLMGTAQWVIGRTEIAKHWWQLSEQTAERLGARYQLGLTVAERARRTASQEDVAEGTTILTNLGIEILRIEQVPLL